MRIEGINTGIEFEDLMIRVLTDAGMSVYDTPVSNDYGADLIIEYDGHRIAGQCKYYTSAVGVKAIQEVLGAIAYYDCDAGVVFTNETFTQQAVNLASANGILLIDGSMLEIYFDDFSMFNSVFNGFFHKSKATVQIPRNTVQEWTTQDLVVRYGLSNQTIMKNFLSRGLPYYKVGREYRYNPDDVFWWEIDTHYVTYGKKGIYLLPGYEQYRKSMNAKIKMARSNGDNMSVKHLKKAMRTHHVSRISDRAKKNIASILSFILMILIVVIVLHVLRTKR